MPLRAGSLGLATVQNAITRKGIFEVRLFHTPGQISTVFDDPNLVSSAGLVPVMRLAERAGLGQLADQP